MGIDYIRVDIQGLVAYCFLFLMVTFLVVLLDLFVGRQIPSMAFVLRFV